MDFKKEIEDCIATLQSVENEYEQFVELPEEIRIELLTLCGQLSRPDQDQIKKRKKIIRLKNRKKKTIQERQARAATGIRRARESEVFCAPKQLTDTSEHSSEPLKLNSPRNCYVCKKEFTELHFFYDTMCNSCAELNYQKRFQKADLTGQVALITGSRLKIGYQATLLLLRSGATVIATTRFPADSALRFMKESDYGEWKERLQIYGLDLRHTPSVEIFCKHIEKSYNRLDILINNAAQTVRRPPGFYAHLMQNETTEIEQLPLEAQHLLSNFHECTGMLSSIGKPLLESEQRLPVSWQEEAPGIGLRESARLSQIPYAYDTALSTKTVFPEGKLDADLQQVDLRKKNSWRLKLGDIETTEMLEIQLVNVIAPFVLCNKLLPLMQKDFTGKKHIVNVSAMEGKFHRFKKASRHPHTNMAKAALNMLSHTASADLEKQGIFINAVDTGWVTDEDPAHLAKQKEDLHDFQPPLDIVDGAARVCDPFFDGINSGKHRSGKFLKDYFPIDW